MKSELGEIKYVNKEWAVARIIDLEAEVRRLKDKYEGSAPKCNRGHVNHLPLALWDCPMCTEEIRADNVRLRAWIDLIARQLDYTDRDATEADKVLCNTQTMRTFITGALKTDHWPKGAKPHAE